jgi:fructokinase
MPAARRAVVFGEVVIDVYPDEEVPAGSPLHVAAQLARRGWKVHLVTRVGDDHDGKLMRDLLEEHGVATELVEVDPALPTGRVTVDAGGTENRFVIHGPAAWDAIAGPPALPAHDVLCFGTLAARSRRSRSTLARLLSSSGAPLKVLDTNLRPPDVARDVVAAAIAAATAIKVSETELSDAAQLLGIDPEPAALFAIAPGLTWLCVTRGEQGADLHQSSGRSWTHAPEPVSVVNTVGAGDAFTAGLIEGLAAGGDGGAALRLGHELAAAILTKRGALPDAPKGSEWVRRGG